MKKTLFILALILVVSCTQRNSTPSEAIREYYAGFENGDYNRVKRTIADSLAITEGDYVMSFTPESFYEQFKWDSVFKPNYNLVELEDHDGRMVATVAVKSLRFEFLKNNPLTCKHRFHFQSGKIAKIESLDCIDANWEIWQKERDSLVEWTKINHPELDGFINDLSMKGAINYLKAIALYKKNEFKE